MSIKHKRVKPQKKKPILRIVYANVKGQCNSYRYEIDDNIVNRDDYIIREIKKHYNKELEFKWPEWIMTNYEEFEDKIIITYKVTLNIDRLSYKKVFSGDTLWNNV